MPLIHASIAPHAGDLIPETVSGPEDRQEDPGCHV